MKAFFITQVNYFFMLLKKFKHQIFNIIDI
jgi:hypothetical protein